MTQLSKRTGAGRTKPAPATPRQAARRRDPIDRLLEPELFKALSDPTRVRLLACLVKCSRPCSVTEVAECCSVDFSVVARHLSLLARCGVLEAEKQGRTVFYTPRTGALADRFDALAAALRACGEAGGCCAGGEGDDACC